MSETSTSRPPVDGTTAPSLPRMGELRQDVALAVALAHQGRAHGEAVAALRRRLCGYVRGLTGPARDFAASRPTAAERDGYASTVRRAIAVADAGGRAGPDAAQSLRALARAVDTLARMAAAGRGTPSRPRSAA